MSIEHIERAINTEEYQRYALEAGEALARAALAYTTREKEAALADYKEIMAKQAALVRSEAESREWYESGRYRAESDDERAAERAEDLRAERDAP